MDVGITLSLFILVLVSHVMAQGNPGESKEKRSEAATRLLKTLFENYDSEVIPDGAHLKFGAALLSTKFIADQSLLESNMWLRMVWNDARLQWNESEFANISVINLNPSKIWTPDIRLYNSVTLESGGLQASCEKTKVLIYPSGEVLWVPPCHFKSNCKNSLNKSPNDPQTCLLKFASWTYDGFRLTLGLYNNETKLDLSDFEDITDWKILRAPGQLNQKYYSCCDEPYLDISFNVVLQRNSGMSVGLTSKPNNMYMLLFLFFVTMLEFS